MQGRQAVGLPGCTPGTSRNVLLEQRRPVADLRPRERACTGALADRLAESGEAIYRLARRKDLPRSDAEDVRQDALAAAWAKRDQCSPNSSQVRWLLGSASERSARRGGRGSSSWTEAGDQLGKWPHLPRRIAELEDSEAKYVQRALGKAMKELRTSAGLGMVGVEFRDFGGARGRPSGE